MTQDFDTQPQILAFDQYLEDSAYKRRQSQSGAYGYAEEEWESFQSGWNAAKQYFEVSEK